MDRDRLKTQCLALPGATEDFPFGDEVSVFKIGGKMFALSHLDTLDGSLPGQMVTDLLGDSYDLVVASLPKARRPPARP